MDFDALEHKLAQLESELLELNGNSDRLHRSHNELLELQVLWLATAVLPPGCCCAALVLVQWVLHRRVVLCCKVCCGGWEGCGWTPVPLAQWAA